jgi:exosortase family protein XrtG
LPYYVVATVGTAYGLVLLSHDWLSLDVTLGQATVWWVNSLAVLAGVPTRVFDGAPGVLMVMVISQEVGWTMLQVGVESSGMLELCVLSSLLLYYPGWSWRGRLLALLLGIAATWAANVLRLLVIAVMLHYLGKDALMLAHTFVGKAVFFALTIGIYGWLITFPTVRALAPRARPS